MKLKTIAGTTPTKNGTYLTKVTRGTVGSFTIFWARSSSRKEISWPTVSKYTIRHLCVRVLRIEDPHVADSTVTRTPDAK